MKRILLFLIAGSLIFGVSGTATATLFNGHDYVIVDYPGQSWDSATSHMLLTLGSSYHLTTITSQAEQVFIETLLSTVGGTEYWIGGHQASGATEPGGSWSWVNGEGLFWDNGTVSGMYANWNLGEPNNTLPNGENFLGIVIAGSSWVWNDEGYLDNIQGYIAESPVLAPIPEPTTVLLLGSGLIGLAGLRRKLKKS